MVTRRQIAVGAALCLGHVFMMLWSGPLMAWFFD
jgi:hypothetical protein